MFSKPTITRVQKTKKIRVHYYRGNNKIPMFRSRPFQFTHLLTWTRVERSKNGGKHDETRNCNVMSGELFKEVRV